jgi:beta-lactamase regulating signal transducer with metallopeptidase domain
MGEQDEEPTSSEQARPGESEAQRADRNFNDILQELRVTQTGVQILFGFLLTMPLQARFGQLDHYEKGLLVIAALLLATATACIIAPVAWHRTLFRHQVKKEIVNASNVFAKAGLTALALGIVASMLLMLDLVLPRWAAVTLGVALGVLLLMLWVVSPVLRRREMKRA